MVQQTAKEAYVTLVTSDNYGVGALVLAHSLRDAGSVRRLVCLVTAAVSPLMQGRLRDVFDEVRVVDAIQSTAPNNLALLGRPDLLYTFTKLHVFSLVDYARVVFLDADTLVLGNVDELFEMVGDGGFAACPDIGWPDCFNSGVFVCSPNTQVFQRLLQLGQSEGSFDGGDQGLLNDFFQGKWTRLPFVYNVTPSATYSYLPAYRRFGSQIKIVHFIGAEKPWMWDRYSDGTPMSRGRPGEALEFVAKWWAVHDMHISKWSQGVIASNPSNQSSSIFTHVNPSTHYNQHAHAPSSTAPANPFFKSRYDWDEKELGMSSGSSGATGVLLAEEDHSRKLPLKKPVPATATDNSNTKSVPAYVHPPKASTGLTGRKNSSIFLGTFISGSLPLLMPLSDLTMRLASAYGAGLLVGTALVVVIPEGVDTLYSSSAGTVMKKEDVYKREMVQDVADKEESTLRERDQQGKDGHSDGALKLKRRSEDEDLSVRDGDSATTIPNHDQHEQEGGTLHHQQEQHQHDESTKSEGHGRTVGVALILGFGLMYIIDQFTGGHSHSSPGHHHGHLHGNKSGEGGDQGLGLLPLAHSHTSNSGTATVDEQHDQPTSPKETHPATSSHSPSTTSSSSNSTLIGLIIHSASDGLAMGAAFSSSQTHLHLLIFFAILLHKAPSAFALGTYLIAAHVPRRRARRQLMVFSAAAPLSTVLTYLVLNGVQFGEGEDGVESARRMVMWTGIVLLFSAGSFLYVAAVHVLPEMMHETKAAVRSGGRSGDMSGAAGKVEVYRDTLIVVLGMVTPLILQSDHHGH